MGNSLLGPKAAGLWGQGGPWQWQPSPPHLLGFRRQRLLHKGFPQEVQVIQATVRWWGCLCWGSAIHAGGLGWRRD